jgi:hypothetical protein
MPLWKSYRLSLIFHRGPKVLEMASGVETGEVKASVVGMSAGWVTALSTKGAELPPLLQEKSESSRNGRQVAARTASRRFPQAIFSRTAPPSAEKKREVPAPLADSKASLVSSVGRPFSCTVLA